MDDIKMELKGLIDAEVSAIKSDLETKYAAETEARIAEHKEAMEKKVGIYATEVQADRKALNDATRTMVKAVFRGDTKSLGTTPDATAGYLVNTDLASEIERLATEFGVARREMNLVTLSSHALRIPVALTDISVFWTGERAAKTSTQPSFDQVTLELSKIAAIVPMTDEFIEDVEFDIFGYIAEVAAEKMVEKEDLAFFRGDGSAGFGGFTGLLESADVGEVIMAGGTFASMTADDLLDMVDATPQGGLVNGKYYMHRSVRSIVRKLKDNEGAYIYQAPSASGPATIWGYPVVEVEAFPATTDSAPETSFVLFGNLRKAAWVGVKAGGLSVMLSNQATVRNVADTDDINLFEQDMSALRFVERIGYTPVLPKAVTKLTTGAISA
jgi:HK97 family phage major capsid protein